MAPAPLVSVIMANWNGAAFLEEAMQSVLGQSHRRIELILSDDGSTDASLAIAERIARADNRVRIVAGGAASGPGGARNRALDLAEGDWIAIVDSDDALHPERFERLLARAEALGADIVADDLVMFGATNGQTLLGAKQLAEPWDVSPRDFLAAEMARPPIPVGYLKPIIRRAALGVLRYRDGMRVGEDYDLLLRVLLSGARLIVVPEGLYFYRRHSASISHRLSEADAEGMIEALDEISASAPVELQDLLAARRRMHVGDRDFARLVARIKEREFGGTLWQVVRQPALVRPLARAARENLGRRWQRASPHSQSEAPKLDAIP